jgi:Secretion system C-terminal sorting domain
MGKYIRNVGRDKRTDSCGEVAYQYNRRFAMKIILALLLLLPLCSHAQSSCLDHNPSDQLTVCSSNETPKSIPSVVHLYPNPTQDEVRVANTEGVNLVGDWVVTNSVGQQVLAQKAVYFLDMSVLANGVYVVQFNRSFLFKIVKY